MPITEDLDNRYANNKKSRIIVFGALALLTIFSLVFRLYYLQLKMGSEYSQKGQTNFIKHIRLPADRGFIYDSWGRLLVENKPSLDVYATPAFIQDLDYTMTLLAKILSLPKKEKQRISEEIKEKKNLDRLLPFLIKRNISRNELAAVENLRSLYLLDGVDIQEAHLRKYRYNETACHLLGYLNEIGPRELERKKEQGADYKLGDMIGRMGIEYQHEDMLRGVDGHKLVVSDAKGRIQYKRTKNLLQDRVTKVPPKPGNSVILSLDILLQQTAQKAFLEKGAKEASLVAMDVNTGFILAMVSLPLFNPNELSSRPDPASWKALINNTYKPLLNRGIQEHYAPGSTYKVITALAALEHAQLKPWKKVRCSGSYTMGDTTWRCWKDRGHGKMDLRDGIQHSCDVYFYTLGAMVQLDALAATAREYGFGSRTGFPLGIRTSLQGKIYYDEQPGIIPDVQWRKNTVDGFHKGDVINNSIGQGDTNVTPLQMAVAYAAIANGGYILKPQIVQRIESPHGEWKKYFQPQIIRKTNASNHDLKLIRDGLCAAVNERGGTAYYRRSRKIKVCGKTGTAQVISLGKERHDDLTDVDYWHKDHAWFAAFAPADDPQIVVVAVHEHGGHGSSGAAPIVMKTIEAWHDFKGLKGTASKANPWIISQSYNERVE